MRLRRKRVKPPEEEKPFVLETYAPKHKSKYRNDAAAVHGRLYKHRREP